MVLFSLDGDVLEAGVVHCKAWVGERRRAGLSIGGGGGLITSVPYRMEIPKGGCLRPAADPTHTKTRPPLAPYLQMGAAFSGGEVPRNPGYVSNRALSLTNLGVSCCLVDSHKVYEANTSPK